MKILSGFNSRLTISTFQCVSKQCPQSIIFLSKKYEFFQRPILFLNNRPCLKTEILDVLNKVEAISCRSVWSTGENWKLWTGSKHVCYFITIIHSVFEKQSKKWCLHSITYNDKVKKLMDCGCNLWILSKLGKKDNWSCYAFHNDRSVTESL